MKGPDVEERITELWEEIPTSFGTARAERLIELGHHLMTADRCQEALPVIETAEDLFAEAGDDRSVGRAAHNRAVVLGRLHRTDEGINAERASIAAFERAQRLDLAGCSRMALGFTLRGSGRTKEALAVFLSAEADFVASREHAHRANALVAILDIRVDLGQFPAAARLLGPALAGAAAAAPVPEVASLHELAARVLEVRSGPEAAIAALRRARAIWDAVDDDARVAACDILIATHSIATVGPATAAKTLRQLRAERQLMSDPAGVAGCDRGLGRIALQQGRFKKAAARLDDAATVFHACALFGPAAECDASAAEALIALGQTDDARRRLVDAIRGLVKFHRPVAETRARLVLDDLLASQGDVRTAIREAKKAETLARRGPLHVELDRARLLRRRLDRPRPSRSGRQ